LGWVHSHGGKRKEREKDVEVEKKLFYIFFKGKMKLNVKSSNVFYVDFVNPLEIKSLKSFINLLILYKWKKFSLKIQYCRFNLKINLCGIGPCKMSRNKMEFVREKNVTQKEKKS